LLDERGQELSQVENGQKVCLRFSFQVHEDIPWVGFAYHIRSANGVEVVYSDTGAEDLPIVSVAAGGCYVLEWKFCVDLQEGSYNVAACMSIPLDVTVGKVDFCDFVPCAVQFSVLTDPHRHLYGYVHWHNDVTISRFAENGRMERIVGT
ncbi:MAG: Wzt carbohydrate-binding domain-containing protein, partial [Selenomonadaceae bacterium]|nr:Wzt carbohydrate-binding domain-containing protein [Selenomonadaceae bacterium]